MLYMLKRAAKWFIFLVEQFRKKKFCEFQSFPFDPLKPLPPHSHHFLQQCCEILEKAGIAYRLTDGTVLGLYRQGAFIEHDNDIDIDVFRCSQKDIHSVIKLFEENSLTLGRIAIYNGIIQQVIFFDSSSRVFDMLFWYEKKGECVNYSERGYVRTQALQSFLNLDSIEFKDKVYPIPGNIEDWLVARYGEDWRVPKTYKGDWKEECFDLAPISES